MPSFTVPGTLVDPPANPRVTGNIYEELGRGILALAGTLGRTSPTDGARVDAFLGDEMLIETMARPGWNDVRIIARGNVVLQILNDRLVSDLIDGDDRHRAEAGLIGLQVHVGPPSKVEFRHIRLKRLD